jgi:hypothetical protein
VGRWAAAVDEDEGRADAADADEGALVVEGIDELEGTAEELDERIAVELGGPPVGVTMMVV